MLVDEIDKDFYELLHYISTLNITHKKDGLLISEFLIFLILGTGGIEIGGSSILINEKLIQIMSPASNSTLSKVSEIIIE